MYSFKNVWIVIEIFMFNPKENFTLFPVVMTFI